MTASRAAEIGDRETDTADRVRWARRGMWLVAGTMAYNSIEAFVALWAGLVAGSVALVGFGLDSVIEMAAAGVVLWRMTIEGRGANAVRVGAAEARVRRFVGATFVVLAIYVMGRSARALLTHHIPSESTVGIVLAGVSLSVMPLVAFGKFRVANALGSHALRAEAKETLACSYLSFCLLLGLAASAISGWWWADPTAAALMVPWLVREGWEALDEDGH